MHPVLAGFVSGAISGIVMGIISHMLFRFTLFKSSLIIIDGSFFTRTMKLQDSPSLIFISGLCIHLMTSGVFGALYFVAASVLGFTGEAVLSFPLVGLYVAFLWLSMLCIALPVAGEGFFGKKSGAFSWLEQLFLHAIFFVLYYGCLRML